MKTIRGEADTNEGLTIRILMCMAAELAEALGAIQKVVAQYDALAIAYGIPACPNPPEG